MRLWVIIGAAVLFLASIVGVLLTSSHKPTAAPISQGSSASGQPTDVQAPEPPAPPAPSPATQPAGATLRGQLLFGTHPAPNERIALLSPNSFSSAELKGKEPPFETRTDARGRFEFDGIPAGTLMVARRYTRPGFSDGTLNFYSEQRMIHLDPGECKDVTLGGGGREVVGHLNISETLKKWNGWHYGTYNVLRFQAEPPPLPMPASVRQAGPDAVRRWMADFRSTEAGKEYAEAEKKASEIHHDYPLEFGSNGDYVVRDVLPGFYMLDIALVRNSQSQDTPGMVVLAGTGWEGRIDPAPKDHPGAPVRIADLFVQQNQYVFPGDPAPDFSLTTIDGKKLTLGDFKGRYVLMNFWGVPFWSSKFDTVMPHVKSVHDTFGHDSRLAIVSVGMNSLPDMLRESAAKNHFDWDQVNGTGPIDNSPFMQFGEHSGGAFLIGPDGMMIATNLAGKDIDKVVAAALGSGGK